MRDGFTSLIGGQHESLASSLLKSSNYHKGINTTLRNGLIQTRPPWRKLAIADLPKGTFKGAQFINRNEDSRLCLVLGKSPVLVDLEALKVAEAITDEFESDFDRAYICAAEHTVIIQNGTDRAMVHITTDTYNDEGELVKTTTAVKRMDEDAQELPIGTFMLYVHGRIFVVTDKRLFKAGDPFVTTDPESFLNFKENDYVNGGGAFGLPGEIGEITGFARTSNTGKDGTGALQVHANNGVAAFNVQSPRYLWGETDISDLIYTGPGSVSDRSFINSNADLFFRSNDGVRSFGFTIATERNPNGMAFRDISREISPSLDADTAESIRNVSMAKADERISCTVHPDVGIYKALAMMDIAPATTVTAPASPAWDGLWTGLDVHQVVSVVRNGKAEILAIAELDGEIGLFVLDNKQILDNGTTPIKSRIYTKSFAFESTDIKQFEFAEVSVSNIQTATTLKAYYRPTGYPLWAELDTHTIAIPEGGLAQPRRKIRFTPESMDVPYNPVTDAKLTSGEAFEFCLEWTGKLQVESFIVEASAGNEEFIVAKTEGSIINIEDGKHGVALNDLDYEVKK